ncbi:MAG: sigma-70 family RNA polymerase sigma factor [Chlorobi bacterium]|nr:sigma-70 family RNA polymerase sigma factor [Chlorobiota bacterium]
MELQSEIIDHEKFWKEFTEGSQLAFTILYNHHIDQLFAYGIKLFGNDELVKDCIHEVFLDLHLHRETISYPRNLKSYLFKALKSTIFRRLKRERKYATLPNDDILIFDLEYSIEDKIIAEEVTKEQKQIVETILRKLNKDQREIIFLKFESGFDYDEIAEIIGINRDSVYKQVYRILKKLRDILEKESMVLFFIYSLLNGAKKKIKKDKKVVQILGVEFPIG